MNYSLTPNCPHCHRPIDSQAVKCTYCGNLLKAFGHPGIPLHRATGEDFLCDSCTYHHDDSCTFPQRPYAKTCTLYENILESYSSSTPDASYSKKYNFIEKLKLWCQRNTGLLTLLVLVAISFLITLLN